MYGSPSSSDSGTMQAQCTINKLDISYNQKNREFWRPKQQQKIAKLNLHDEIKVGTDYQVASCRKNNGAIDLLCCPINTSSNAFHGCARADTCWTYDFNGGADSAIDSAT
uniref:SFRICE_035425 n=1 Tax=Spodoptera frugiperda TaxID=7108 RepID=A0A2H1VEB6_SPOFR